MIHMLSSFDLKPGQALDVFQSDYAEFVADLKEAEMVVDAGPLGKRVADTPMDTDEDRDHSWFSILTFRDRAQLDAAYAYIEARQNPSTTSHIRMYRRITNSIFLCWEDLPTEKDAP